MELESTVGEQKRADNRKWNMEIRKHKSWACSKEDVNILRQTIWRGLQSCTSTWMILERCPRRCDCKGNAEEGSCGGHGPARFDVRDESLEHRIFLTAVLYLYIYSSSKKLLVQSIAKTLSSQWWLVIVTCKLQLSSSMKPSKGHNQTGLFYNLHHACAVICTG